MAGTIEPRLKTGFLDEWRAWSGTRADYTRDTLKISGHPVMERWETPYMEELAKVAASNGGRVMELGYGMGISASFILNNQEVREHTIIEANRDVYKKAQKDLAPEIAEGRVKLVRGFWEDIIDKLPSGHYDGILFDTYPLKEGDIHRNHFPFFRHAKRLLRSNGILTYYSDESSDFSEEHGNALGKAGFTKIAGYSIGIDTPYECEYWQEKSFLVPVISK